MTIVSGHENNVFQARALPYTDNEKVGLRCRSIPMSNGIPPPVKIVLSIRRSLVDDENSPANPFRG